MADRPTSSSVLCTPVVARHAHCLAQLANLRADVSTIVSLDEPVTSFQQTAVVTEQGVARLWGYDEKTQ